MFLQPMSFSAPPPGDGHSDTWSKGLGLVFHGASASIELFHVLLYRLWNISLLQFPFSLLVLIPWLELGNSLQMPLIFTGSNKALCRLAFSPPEVHGVCFPCSSLFLSASLGLLPAHAPPPPTPSGHHHFFVEPEDSGRWHVLKHLLSWTAESRA